MKIWSILWMDLHFMFVHKSAICFLLCFILLFPLRITLYQFFFMISNDISICKWKNHMGSLCKNQSNLYASFVIITNF